MVCAYLCSGHTVLCQSLPCPLCMCMLFCVLVLPTACVLKLCLCAHSICLSSAQLHARLCLMPFVNRCTGGAEAQLRLSEVELEAVPTRKELTMPVPKTAVAHGDVNLDVHAFLAKFKA